MPKRVSKLSKSLKELGDIQVNSLELPGILNKEITDLEITQALQRLGNIQVTEWEVRNLLPKVQRLAQKEIDVIGLMRQVADYKVIDWDFRDAFQKSSGGGQLLSGKKMAAITCQLQNFLKYVISSLIKEPNYASYHAEEIAPQILCFKVVLKQRDLSALIGMNGRTAGPIRRILKAAALHHGVCVLLHIESHEDAARSEAAH